MSDDKVFPVRVGSENDSVCSCQENGKDGTTTHGDVVGIARCQPSELLIVTAAFCENHRANYEHWEQLRPASAEGEER